MAFGFLAYHTERYLLPDSGIDPHELVVEALDRLRWSVTVESEGLIRASTRVNIWSWGERIVIEFEESDTLIVTSKCALPTQCFDWGQNRSNVVKFLRRVERLLDSRDRDAW